MGDFNVNLLNHSHYLYDDLSDLMSAHNLHQFVTQPTFYSPNATPSLLDHVYSNDSDLVTHVAYHAPLGLCHHSVIHCHLRIQQTKPDSVYRTIWLYNKADWGQLTRSCLIISSWKMIMLMKLGKVFTVFYADHVKVHSSKTCEMQKQRLPLA